MVANVGRQPVTVARWGLRSGLGMSLYPAAGSIGPRLPHRLEVGESETWAVDLVGFQKSAYCCDLGRRVRTSRGA